MMEANGTKEKALREENLQQEHARVLLSQIADLSGFFMSWILAGIGLVLSAAMSIAMLSKAATATPEQWNNWLFALTTGGALTLLGGILAPRIRGWFKAKEARGLIAMSIFALIMLNFDLVARTMRLFF